MCMIITQSSYYPHREKTLSVVFALPHSIPHLAHSLQASEVPVPGITC